MPVFPYFQAEAKKKKKKRAAVASSSSSSSSSCSKKHFGPSGPEQEVVVQNRPPPAQLALPGLRLGPGQSMWVMTAAGLVQLAEAPPQGLQVTVVPGLQFPGPAAQPAVPPAASMQSAAPRPTAVSVPLSLSRLSQPHTLCAPPTGTAKSPSLASVRQPVPEPGSHPRAPSMPQRAPKLFLPYKGTVRVDPTAPPPLRREALQFDPSLMFLEPQEAVCDWLSGRGGVLVPGAGVALPYLPPFVSSLRTLIALLCAKKSLSKSSLQLLSRGSEPQHPTTKPQPDSSTMGTSSQPPDLPDSTSDHRPGNTVGILQVAPSVRLTSRSRCVLRCACFVPWQLPL